MAEPNPYRGSRPSLGHGGVNMKQKQEDFKSTTPHCKGIFGNSRKQKESKKSKRLEKPKWTEKIAQKSKMKGNKSPKDQNERKWSSRRPKWKEMKTQKAKKLQNAAGLGVDKICLNFIRKRTVFGNLRGGPHVAAQANKNERKWNPKGQNDRKWKLKRLKWKEMKAQKAKPWRAHLRFLSA